MKLSNKRIAEIEAADEHAPGGMGLPFISELLSERKEREKATDALHNEIGRLEKEMKSLEKMVAIREETVGRWRNAEDDYQDLFEEFGVQNAELAKHVVIMDEALDALESTEKAGKEK